MRILLVSKQFYPDQNPRAFRAFELARELALQGHKVKVYTAICGYDYSKVEEEYGFEVHAIEGLKFIHTRRDKPYQATFYKKMLNRMFGRIAYFPEIELTFKIPNALKSENNYDLLISIAIPFSVHWGCALALNTNKSLAKTWIADCGDPFMGNTFTSYPFYFRLVERWLCKKVTYLTVPTKEAINAYESQFRSKIKVIPQGFRFTKSFEAVKANDIPTFAYAGMLYKDKRDPKLFLEYLCTINSDFKFILYTKSLDLIRPYMSILGNKIEIRSMINRDQLLVELSKMDFLVNFENAVAEQTPSKLIDYALTNLPILSIPSNCIDPNIVDEFLAKNYKNQVVIKNIEQYNIVNVAQQFIQLHTKEYLAKVGTTE